MSKKPPPPPPKKPQHLASGTTTESTSSPPQPLKRGIGWPWDYPAEHFPLYTPHTPSPISWLFNWELWVPASLPPSLEWVPCVRTAANAPQVLPFLTDIIDNQGRRNVTALLGFNEPEIPEQANMSVEDGVRLWKEVCVSARQKWGLRLGSPGISSDLGRSGPWMDAFLRGLGERERPDFLVVHWYGRDFGGMKWFVEECYRRWGLLLWLNEFACSSMGQGETSEEEVEAFMREAVPWLDGCEFVERYAYFGNGQRKTVGEWVGRANDFSVLQESGPDGRALSRVAKLYTEL